MASAAGAFSSWLTGLTSITGRSGRPGLLAPSSRGGGSAAAGPSPAPTAGTSRAAMASVRASLERLRSEPRLRYVARRVVGRRPSLFDVASELEELHPAVERVAPPALVLDGQTDRIASFQEETDAAEQHVRLRGGPQRHDATVRVLLENVLLVGGDLYAGGLRVPLRPGSRPAGALAPMEGALDDAALVQTYNGSRYFGHWLLDDRATHLMAARYGAPVAVPIALSAQQRAYLALFEQQDLHEARALRVRRLHVFLDVGQNPHRTARIDELRARFHALGAQHLASASASPDATPLAGGAGRVVFICRGHAGARRVLLNEETLASSLERRGVRVLRAPEQQELPALAAQLAGAELVVGMDSSGLAHGVLGVARGGGFVVISPADRHNNTFKDWCDPLGVRYGMVVASARPEGYTVDDEEVLRTIDLVVRARRPG